MNNLRKLIKNQSISRRGHAIRKSRISLNRAAWILNGEYKNTRCEQYRIARGWDKYCNCIDYATDMWKNLTSRWEDFSFNDLQYTPDQLVDKLWSHTAWKKTVFLDGGKRWQ